MFRILILLPLIVGCSVENYVRRNQEPKCSTPAEKRELAAFIVACAKAANPMSDEEGEDLVAQCENTGVRTVCPFVETCQTVTNSGGFMEHDRYSTWAPCEAKQ